MSIRRVFLAVLMFLALLNYPSFAQSGRGTVAGSVADAQGGGLQGAKITLDPGGATSLSDVTGQFTVNNVASGDYALTVSYSCFDRVPQIKLDIIPSDLVESVQINKTLQANMPGDGIGGSVDLRTKSAGDRPTVALESTAGYTPIIGGRPVYQFDGTVGRRFNGKKLG